MVVATSVPVTEGTYPIVIGSGGTVGTSNADPGGNGGETTGLGKTAAGGGGGGAYPGRAWTNGWFWWWRRWIT